MSMLVMWSDGRSLVAMELASLLLFVWLFLSTTFSTITKSGRAVCSMVRSVKNIPK